MAAYRFLSNEEVEWIDMMQPHWARTAMHMGQHAVVLCIADTIELDFNDQDMEGLGPLSFEAQRGMYLHPTYAVTPDREPLVTTGRLDVGPRTAGDEWATPRHQGKRAVDREL
jgi:hypothetical protein